MRRRTPTAVAVLCGGGPADGERRPVEEGAEEILVDEPAHEDGPVPLADAVRAHRYARQADGRFAYAGPVERLPELPESLHEDTHAQGIAALGHDAGPSALSIIAMIVLVAVIMYCFGVYT